MWQHDKRTGDYQIIMNCVRKIDEKIKLQSEKKRPGKAQTLKKDSFVKMHPAY